LVPAFSGTSAESTIQPQDEPEEAAGQQRRFADPMHQTSGPQQQASGVAGFIGWS